MQRNRRKEEIAFPIPPYIFAGSLVVLFVFLLFWFYISSLKSEIQESKVAILLLEDRLQKSSDECTANIKDAIQKRPIQKCPPSPSCPVFSRYNLWDIAMKEFGYESPLIDLPTAREVYKKYAKIPDGMINWQPIQQKELWNILCTFKEERMKVSPFFLDGMIPDGDAFALFTMIRHFKPKIVIEIGGGFSTRIVKKAMALNRNDSGPNEQIVIEPFRADLIRSIGEVKVIETTLQKVDVEIFETLGKNDILLIDSSHVIAPYGDTILEIVFIIPRLKPGVIVYVHDIVLPYDYPYEWNIEQFRHYTEQYLLAAFLAFNSEFKVLLSLPQLTRFSDESMQNKADCGLTEHGASVWIQRIS